MRTGVLPRIDPRRTPAGAAGDVRVWFVSNLPPPVHGVSIFNGWLLPALRARGVSVSFIRVGSQEASGQLGMFGARKLIRDATTMLRFFAAGLWHRLTNRGHHVLYFTPSQSGPGVFRDVIVAGLGKLVADRIVAHVHGCGWLVCQQRDTIVSELMRRTLGHSDIVICLGETFAARMREATSYNCIGIDNGTPVALDAGAKRLPAPGGDVSALFLSNFIPSKGLTVAAQAIRLLRSEGRGVTLRCGGAWRRLEDAQEFTSVFRRELDSGAIEVVGPVEPARKLRLLQEAHFFLLPTRYPLEGQPLALIEALSHGVVPLTTDQGGIPDLMNFPGGDRMFGADLDRPEPLARAIARLMDNSTEYEHLSGNCIAHHRGSLDFERCADEILQVLRVGYCQRDGGPTGRRAATDARAAESPAEIGAK